MTTTGTTVELSALDAFRPASPDPATWSANLAAAGARNPALGGLLRDTPLPESWRPALALDNSVTYRLEEAGQPASWLGGTAAPATRAGASLAEFDPAGKNSALPCISAGYELRLLLERLPPHLAVYIFESDLAALGAALRIHRLEDAIAAGRCLLIPPGDEESFLTELLGTHPGVLPPGNIVLPNLVPPQRLAELRAICEQIHARTMQRRARRLSELAAQTPRQRGPLPPAPRLAILALTADRSAHWVAQEIERAAQALAWPVLSRALTGPADAHPLPHCEAIAGFKPDITLCIGHTPATLPTPLSGIACAWFLSDTDVPAALPDDGTLYLGASPPVMAALRRAAAGEHRVLEWYWACDAEDPGMPASPAPGQQRSPAGLPAEALAYASRSDDDETPREEPFVILAGDLPDGRPEPHGVRQASHQRLWEELRATAASAWETPLVPDPQRLLKRAERGCGIELTDSDLRAALLRLVERVIIPAAVLEALATLLHKERVQVLALGRGWQRLAGPGLRPLATVEWASWWQRHPAGWHEHPARVSEGRDARPTVSPSHLDSPDRRASLCPVACVFANQADPLGPALLHAAAAGWPILLHVPAGQSLASSLGDVLQPGCHFEPFANHAELRRALQSARTASTTVRQRVAQAQEHVCQAHSYRRRLESLLRHLQESGRSGA